MINEGPLGCLREKIVPADKDGSQALATAGRMGGGDISEAVPEISSES